MEDYQGNHKDFKHSYLIAKVEIDRLRTSI